MAFRSFGLTGTDAVCILNDRFILLGWLPFTG
jgi:hypothetical protein